MGIDYSKPFKVRIIEDCRDPEDYALSGKLDGHYGLCLGVYKYPNIHEKAQKEKKGNPLILSDNGWYIWCCECWWDPNPEEHEDIPLDLQQKVLEMHKEILRRNFGIDFDPSVN